jgi:ribosomal protein S18 acetylase RimI-like enzyme
MVDLVRTMEADNFAFWEEFARLPGGASGKVDGATWYRSGVLHPNYNGVLGAGCDVDQMLARARSWRLPVRWLIGTGSAGTIEHAFRERGLVLGDEYPAMVAPIADLPEPDMDGVTVEAVETDVQHREWDDVFADAFGFHGDVAEQVSAVHAWPSRHERDRVYMLLRRNGEAVATAILHTPCGVAGIYGITVRRSCRRQGLATLATLATVRAGAERGATMAMLQATTEGFPVYERLGFRTICAFRSWQIP